MSLEDGPVFPSPVFSSFSLTSSLNHFYSAILLSLPFRPSLISFLFSSILYFIYGSISLGQSIFLSFVFHSPHIIFLSQSVLCAGTFGPREDALSLCGSRICHEIAHSWFGLLIGARDWTEEWISEGFATYLEDIIWAQAKQVQ